MKHAHESIFFYELILSCGPVVEMVISALHIMQVSQSA